MANEMPKSQALESSDPRVGLSRIIRAGFHPIQIPNGISRYAIYI
jgi:hypothetical protein